MLLIIFLDLIANLAFVSDDCDVWTPTRNNFDCSKVGISVLTCLLPQEAV